MPIRDDEARRAYFRDYMRERRAGKKPLLRADWDTISRVIAHWIKYPSRCKPEFAAKVLRQIESLDLKTEDGTKEACRVYLTVRAEHRAEQLKREREEKAKRAAEWEAERRIKRCSFCNKPQGDVLRLWGDERGFPLICDQCLALASKDIAAAKPTPKRRPTARGRQ